MKCIEWRRWWMIACISWLQGLSAQAATPDFPNLENRFPYGPGSRSLTATAMLQPSDSTNNLEFVVFYSDSREPVANMTAACPQGLAKITSTSGDGRAELQFIFPHTDNQKPNASDKNPEVYGSGRKVFYRIVKQRKNATTPSSIVEFRMPDKLTIANFGDSYASGEGAPYASGKKWDDELCHRSGNSGQAKAVKEVKAAFPELAIAFKNVACSGASIMDGVLTSQRKATFFQDQTLDAQRVPPQFKQVADWLDSNHYEQLNLALFSVGGNDVHFGAYVQKFLIAPFNLADDASARSNLTRDIDELSVEYDALHDRLEASFDFDHAISTGYPTLLTGANGALCDGRRGDYGACWGPVEQSGVGVLSTSPTKEYAAVRDTFLSPLNTKIRDKAKSYDHWSFVATTAQSDNHGLCNCASAYFNTFGNSLLGQDDPYGTAHPNRRGHEQIYKAALVPVLKDRIKDIKKAYAIERAKEIAAAKANAKTLRASKLAAQPTLKSKSSTVPAAPPLAAETLAAAKATARNAPANEDAPDNRSQEEGN